MAMPYGSGQIESCTVEASIAGAEGTYLENNSYYTNSSGMDIPVEVGSPSVNSGNKTTVTFTTDTCAATLRYYYVIPEEARGKEVTFKFTAKSRDGQVKTVEMGPYKICKQYLKRNITLTKTRCYISLEDMAVDADSGEDNGSDDISDDEEENGDLSDSDDGDGGDDFDKN